MKKTSAKAGTNTRCY